mmetsp:Transcript_32363/g.50418  ORF Transcript_32363/g.50418 Transcript_32363/m.50418 type:complete len:242 (-) Transcript_32363:1076-1801(-)
MLLTRKLGRYSLSTRAFPKAWPSKQIGQYRVECSRYNEAYCKACTNKPEGDNFQYTEPGNGDECAYQDCGGPCVEGGDPNTQATAEFYVEMPVTQEEFGNVEARYVGALVDVSGLDENSVRTLEVESGLLVGNRQLSGDRRNNNSSNTTEALTEALDSCSNEMPEHTEFVRVLTEINTTEDKIPQLWEKLTAYNVAVKFSELCLPPPLVDYSYDSGANSLRMPSWLMVLGATALAAMIHSV